MIKIGDTLPDTKLSYLDAEGMDATSLHQLSSDGVLVVCAVPGAFTPTCSVAHLPGFRDHADELKAAGADKIVCISVNDPFVMKAWGEASNVGDSILMLADGNAAATSAMGLEMDASGFGMGRRSLRYSMIAKDGKVLALHVEEGGGLDVSSAEATLEALQGLQV